MQKKGLGSNVWIILLVLVIAAAAYFGRGIVGRAPEEQPGGFGVPVETALVQRKALDITIDAVGTLVANEMVMLRPEIAGKITEIRFTEGQPIKKGESLFQIDDRMARAELKQAQSNAQLAQLNNNRFRTLSKSGAATKLRYDEAQAELGVSQANLDLARTRVEYSNITAPFDGVVGLRKVSPGEYVNVGQELANFVSYDPMKVNFTIPETDASRLAVGQTIDITVEALPGQAFRGAVYALDPQIDVNGRAVSLRATIPNPQNQLKAGYFARIALTVDRKENALTVPESAIVPEGDTKSVFVVGADGKANLASVELGQRLAGEVEIVSGLKEGDVVVTSGQMKLQPGAAVTDLRTANGKPGTSSPVKEERVGEPLADAPVSPSEEPLPPDEAMPLTESVPTDESVNP